MTFGPAGGQNPALFVRQLYLTLLSGKVYFTNGEGMEALPRTIEIYIDAKGKRPFVDWRDCLDVNTRARVRTRLNKVEGGNLGDHKAEGGGVFALRLDFGPGYRIYYGLTNEQKIVLLLSGGDKKKQNQDIQEAIRLWEEYKERKAKEEKDKKKG